MDQADTGVIPDREPQIAVYVNDAEPLKHRPFYPSNMTYAAIGIAVSLLLHGILLTSHWNRAPSTDRFDHDARPVLQVRLLPVPAPVPSSEADAPRPSPQVETVKHATARAPKRITARIGIPPVTTVPEPAMTTSSTPAPERQLDLDTIHASVGAIAARVERERRDTPVGQLQAKPLFAPDPETKLGRTIAGAARSDCKDRLANTGLLAPFVVLAMAADKKDGGCKW